MGGLPGRAELSRPGRREGVRGIEVATGRSGADMALDVHGDGPVTLVIDVPA